MITFFPRFAAMSLATRTAGYLDQLPTEIFELIITYLVGGRSECYLPAGEREYPDPISCMLQFLANFSQMAVCN